MKEIKFRAWNRVHQFMMEWDDFLDYEADQMAIVGNDYRIFNDDEFELLQYTGFKDKNGKEIYEGDVVKHTNMGFRMGVVSFFEGAFIVGTPITSNALINFNCPKYVERSGNIHENPELLEEA